MQLKQENDGPTSDTYVQTFIRTCIYINQSETYMYYVYMYVYHIRTYNLVLVIYNYSHRVVNVHAHAKRTCWCIYIVNTFNYQLLLCWLSNRMFNISGVFDVNACLYNCDDTYQCQWVDEKVHLLFQWNTDQTKQGETRTREEEKIN